LPASSASAFFSDIANDPAVNTQRIRPRSIIASRSFSLSVFRPLKTTAVASRQRRIGPSNSPAT
jgi:hypothetical protein